MPTINHDCGRAKLGDFNKKIDKMILDLENCPETWWETLPKQGQDRMWLKEIGDLSLPNANNMQHKVEAMMKPYLDFVIK